MTPSVRLPEDQRQTPAAATVVSIGVPPWTRNELRDALAEFAELYEKRPIRDNAGGMQSPQLFCAWFALRRMKPAAIVESGVFLGQGTWFFEQACPDAELHCIDPNLDRIRYRATRARYYDSDFSTLDLRDLVPEETVLFFDDHQNAYERLLSAKWMGFRRMLFEDNYPAGVGDCYSLKKAFAGAGFEPAEPARSVRGRIANLLGAPVARGGRVPPNDIHAFYLRRNLGVYYEFPPVVRSTHTRWGDVWEDARFPTPPSVLDSIEHDWQRVFEREAQQYTWIAYAEIRQAP